MASAATLSKMATICFIVLILTMGRPMAADAAASSPHLQGGRRQLLQLAGDPDAVAATQQQGRNVGRQPPGTSSAAARVRINGPPN